MNHGDSCVILVQSVENFEESFERRELSVIDLCDNRKIWSVTPLSHSEVVHWSPTSSTVLDLLDLLKCQDGFLVVVAPSIG